MKKLLGIIVLGLFCCNIGAAKPIFLNCKDNELLMSNLYTHEYISLDFENKKYLWEGKALVKYEDDISNGEIIHKQTIELPLLKEDSEYLYLGWDFIQNERRNYDIYKFNKQNFDLSHEDNTMAGIESVITMSCNQIDKFPL